MGDVADMILDGLLDEVTGEYIGDQNKQIYGTEAPGFPITYEGKKHIGDINKQVYGTEAPGFPISYEDKTLTKKPRRYHINNVSDPATGKVVCPICKKRVKEVGLRDHQRDKHRTHSQ